MCEALTLTIRSYRLFTTFLSSALPRLFSDSSSQQLW